MGLSIEVIAGAFEGLQKQAQQYDKLADQRKLLELEMLRTAPEGYTVIQGPGGSPQLQYVGMQDPRIQSKMALEKQRQELENQAKIDLETKLNPIMADRNARERQLIEESQLRVHRATQAVGAEAAFRGALQTIRPDELPGLVPEAREAVLGPALKALGELQGFDPARATQLVETLDPTIRQALGGNVQPATAKPPTPGFRTLGLPPSGTPAAAPQPAAPVRTAPASTEPSGAKPAPVAPQDGASLTIDGLVDYVEAQRKAGLSDEAIRVKAVSALRASYGKTLQPGQATDLIDKAIQTKAEKVDLRRKERQAEFEDLKLTLGRAEIEKPVFEAGLAVPAGTHTPDDPYYSLKVPARDKNGKVVEGAPDRDEVRINELAVPQTGTGDARPLAKIRTQIQGMQLEPSVAKELVKQDYGAVVSHNMQALSARPVSDNILLVVAPGISMGSEGDIRLAVKAPAASQADVDRVLSGLPASERREVERQLAIQRERNRGGVPEDSDSGLTPQGVAENVWLSALTGGPAARFVFVQGGVPQSIAGQAAARNAGALSTMRALGIKPPNFKSGFWIDVESLAGPLPTESEE